MAKAPKQVDNIEFEQTNGESEDENESDEEPVIMPAIPTKRKKSQSVTTMLTPIMVSAPGPSNPKRKKPAPTILENGFDVVLEDVENDNDSFQHRIKFGNGTQGNYFCFNFIFHRKERFDCLQPKQKDCSNEILDA